MRGAGAPGQPLALCSQSEHPGRANPKCALATHPEKVVMSSEPEQSLSPSTMSVTAHVPSVSKATCGRHRGGQDGRTGGETSIQERACVSTEPSRCQGCKPKSILSAQPLPLSAVALPLTALAPCPIRTTRLFMVEQAEVKGEKPHWALFDSGLLAEVVATM